MINRHLQPQPALGATRPQLIAPSASPEEMAAIMAAVERFRRETAPPLASARTDANGWLRAAILEGVSRQVHGEAPDPWKNT
jgi:hypothetical protein